MRPEPTTLPVPHEGGLDHWHDALGRALVPMRVVPRADGPFTGRVHGERVGFLRLVTLEADPHRASRTASHIARATEEFVALTVLREGSATLVQHGRQATAGPGDLFVYDTAQPFLLDHPERVRAYVVLMPRRALGLPADDVHRVTGTAIGGTEGCAAVLSPFLRALAASVPVHPPAAATRLASGVVDLFATLVAERTQDGTGPRTGRDHLVLRIRDHIDRELGDPALSPEAIARAHHISVRYLHRLFEDEGVTVGGLIRRRRLEECARELARGGAAPTVVSVAQRWGFVNAAHFSRVFRAAYGSSPREWRALRAGEHPGVRARFRVAVSGTRGQRAGSAG
ncbi:helix-turn-helix domain-containing protein [Streptomyces sp. NPDC052225]|uniref:AraC-like ligand-binding domain-containing protein n=1 Tax=Streptomyces sp. NPDC052225 TaxID=3154949 RepID=UPI0034437C5C